MRITNSSMGAITVIEEGADNLVLAANTSLHTNARKLTLEINYLPCHIEIAEEPEEVTPGGQ